MTRSCNCSSHILAQIGFRPDKIMYVPYKEDIRCEGSGSLPVLLSGADQKFQPRWFEGRTLYILLLLLF